MSYDPNNIFARIIRGEIPSTKVFEDGATLAFMDIMPRTPGHVLVLPKAPARNLLDVAPADLAALMLTVQRIARAAKAGLGADGITLNQFSEAAAGQSVFHLHFHVMPRWRGKPLAPPEGPMEKPEILREYAERIRAALV